MNIPLVESVRHTIISHPQRFCAAQWAFARNAPDVLRHGAAPEGFRCCIAGHVLLQSGACTERCLLRRGGFHTGGPLWEHAASVLSVGENTCHKLFFPSQWDAPYKREYYLCARDEEATLTAKYLEYFVDRYGNRPASGSRRKAADRDRRTPSSARPSARKEARKNRYDASIRGAATGAS